MSAARDGDEVDRDGKGFVIPVIANSVVGEKRGVTVERKKPKESVLALEMMAWGDSLKSIEAKTGLGISSLANLRARHAEALDDRRRQLSADAMEVAEGLRLLQLEKIRMLAEDPKQLAKTNIRDLAIPWGIANDKVFSAMGENKVVIEHKAKAPSIEDAQKAIEEARAALRKGSIEVVVEEANES